VVTGNKSNSGNILKEDCRKEIIKNDTEEKKNTGKTFKKIFSNHIPVSKMINILKKQSCDGVQYVKGNLRINMLI